MIESFSRSKNQRGVSLVELILVIAAVAFLILLLANLPSAISSITKSQHASLARNIVNKQTDYLRKQTYANLANGTNFFSDSALSSLPHPTASYKVEDCPPAVCSNSENLKQITVTVLWTENGDNKSIEVVTLVGEGGLGQ